MKQKLAVANALLPEPDLLILDEPTAGVDVVAREEIRALLGLRRRQALILLSTSYVEEAEACERLVYLDAGRVIARGRPKSCAPASASSSTAPGPGFPRDGGVGRRGRLPYVSGARAGGRFVRIEVPLERTPGSERVLRDVGGTSRRTSGGACAGRHGIDAARARAPRRADAA